MSANPIHAVRPTPIPKGVALVDAPRYSSSIGEKPWLDREVAWVTYDKGDHHMSVSARIGDYNHVGTRLHGSFRDAVGVARMKAALDDIDMPKLGAAAIIRSHTPGEWIIAPLQGYAPGQHYNGDDGATTQLPVDPEHGSDYGPEGIWKGTGSGRGWRDMPAVLSDTRSGALNISAVRTNPDLVAIVGVDRWINFGSAHYAKQLAKPPVSS